ncbi:dienelactone hydrolase family protein [Rhodococcus sp. IEGM 1379]|uniref:alpha/beta hydrolase n=1 Tax=Rhodococcus sp. IEGM 1379 TaxID=3047086 RepID=UPI0024B80909|nr:dienelactone hydrolase family protein [Rhodococcus sp. IEGM 1379]MDI9917740.1 dienelactone hydrolase family protein [Rhodococcus sp. IEGM 1379]
MEPEPTSTICYRWAQNWPRTPRCSPLAARSLRARCRGSSAASRKVVLDEDDLRERTDELAAFINAASSAYAIEPGSLIAVGFSNGANIASSLLARHPHLLAGAVLIAAMVPYRGGIGEVDLTDKRVAIVNGTHDQLVSTEDTSDLTTQFRNAGAQVSVLGHDGGHAIPTALYSELRGFITATTPPPV